MEWAWLERGRDEGGRSLWLASVRFRCAPSGLRRRGSRKRRERMRERERERERERDSFTFLLPFPSSPSPPCTSNSYPLLSPFRYVSSKEQRFSGNCSNHDATSIFRVPWPIYHHAFQKWVHLLGTVLFCCICGAILGWLNSLVQFWNAAKM